MPSTPTAYVSMRLVPFSVTASVRPSGENCTCAGAGAAVLSKRVEFGTGTRRSCQMKNPVMFAVPPLFST